MRPPPVQRTGLALLARTLALRCRGRAIAADDLHLTLVFLGERPASRACALHAQLIDLRWPATDLVFDRIDRFGPTLLWAGLAQAPGWLDDLVAQLRSRLDAIGESYERRPFKAHLTLVRNARDRTAAAAALGPIDASEVRARAGPLQLALGASHAASTSECRYRWWPADQDCHPSVT